MCFFGNLLIKVTNKPLVDRRFGNAVNSQAHHARHDRLGRSKKMRRARQAIHKKTTGDDLGCVFENERRPHGTVVRNYVFFEKTFFPLSCQVMRYVPQCVTQENGKNRAEGPSPAWEYTLVDFIWCHKLLLLFVACAFGLISNFVARKCTVPPIHRPCRKEEGLLCRIWATAFMKCFVCIDILFQDTY